MRVVLIPFLLAMSFGSVAVADDEVSPAALPAPPVLADNPAVAPEAFCEPALAKGQALMRGRHHVDAHLLAQTMGVLCARDADVWGILDAVALTHLEEHERAYALLESISLTPGPHLKRARLLASWVMVKGNLGHPADLGVGDGSRLAVFERIHSGRSPGARAAELSATLRQAVTSGYKRMEATDTKSPWVAGVLSTLVPGMGQAYAGSWQGAGVSLLLNGLFISATVELARNDLYFASATTGVAGSIFYVGNILNAVDLAKRYNEGATQGQRSELESLLIPEAQY